MSNDRPTTTRRRRRVIACLAVIGLGLALASCGDDDDTSSQDTESHARQGGYDELVSAQPAHTMPYSPSRDTINAWIDTWGTPGQLAFTYILNQTGTVVGYYVFVGPPVSYCAALTPTYEKLNIDVGDAKGQVIVPAPGVDGVYYSGGQCIQYYGRDASTGNLIEFTAGGGLNFINSTQPLFLDQAPPALGPTSADQAQPNGEGDYLAEGVTQPG